jgi:uracil-DNA glycosylase
MADTTGPKEAKFAFVSRSPGRYDVDAGYPFAGPSAGLSITFYKQMGYKEMRFLTNVVLCQTESFQRSDSLLF